jgi:non-homologous end joining protein Ku
VATPVEAAPPKVVDLMDALRRSLEQVSGGKKKSAKVAAGATAAKKRKAS